MLSPHLPVLDCLHSFESTDLDETRDRIAAVFSPHRLIPQHVSNPMNFRMELLTISDLGLGTLRYGKSMGVEVPATADHYLLFFCPTGEGRIRTSTTSLLIRGGLGFVCNPGEGFSAAFSDDATQLVVRLDRQLIWSRSGSKDRVFAAQIDLGAPGMAALYALLSLIVSDADATRSLVEDPYIAREFQQLFSSLLLKAQPSVDASRHRSGIAPASVRKAEDYIRCHAHEPIKVADIARAAGVSIRTLSDALRRFRQTNAVQLVSDIRLEKARARLLEAAGPVSSVARDCGFQHLGRFAQAYAGRFGEKPSDTVARAPARPRAPLQASAAN